LDTGRRVPIACNDKTHEEGSDMATLEILWRLLGDVSLWTWSVVVVAFMLTFAVLQFMGWFITRPAAEDAFVILARRWHKHVEAAGDDGPLPKEADTLALSCLRLAVERGNHFTEVAAQQCELNREAVKDRGPMAWIDQLPWDLCRASSLSAASESGCVELLVENLDHHNSSIRRWMMEIGWTAHLWLHAETAMTPLLTNIANTLGAPMMAAGLAAKVARGENEFWGEAERFVPPVGFEDQYQAQIDFVREHSILAMQAPFLDTEAECRKIIEDAIFG
jgi:hypothetical protein